MLPSITHLAYLGPGGPEFILVMLVLIVLFGAKDAPRILRKLNELINKIRFTADDFKREVMYSDLQTESTADIVEDHNEDYDYDTDHFYDAAESPGEQPEQIEEESAADPEASINEEDDVRKD